ncbi:hypothetical protein ColLi_12696 [Colletotrichum liriopes]|uniref:Uncharacterized protein n=1 Tax=Colletotrichum liriopes TaxID=708192 RepID=A0AA37H1G5_9PEZI|nr:hypothetical protein ColLi_12696 [Colletotrichum liriopes]
MLSLDRDEFWFIKATFSNDYLVYITDRDATNIPASPPLAESSLVCFQRYGPFSLASALHMLVFAPIVLAIGLYQLRRFGGQDLWNRRKAAAAAATAASSRVQTCPSTSTVHISQWVGVAGCS